MASPSKKPDEIRIVLPQEVRQRVENLKARLDGRAPASVSGPRALGFAKAASPPPQDETSPEKGIFVGTWAPRDQNGKSLGRVFNVFAAPGDLMDTDGKKAELTFNAAAARIAALKNWHGHDGGGFANEGALYKALAEETYKGEWFIPPRALLQGKDAAEADVQPAHLHGLRDEARFKGTFTTAGEVFRYVQWYWSITEKQDDPLKVCAVSFSTGSAVWARKDDNRLSTRPVRMELAP